MRAQPLYKTPEKLGGAQSTATTTAARKPLYLSQPNQLTLLLSAPRASPSLPGPPPLFSRKSPPKPGSSPRAGAPRRGGGAASTAGMRQREAEAERARGARDPRLAPKASPLGTGECAATPTATQLPPEKGSPRGTDAHERMDGRVQPSGARSVPADLDGGEGPEVGMSHVQQGAAGGHAPAEGGHVVPGGAAGGHQPEGGGHARGGDLVSGWRGRKNQGYKSVWGKGKQRLPAPLPGTALAPPPSCRCRRGSAGAGPGRGRCRWGG